MCVVGGVTDRQRPSQDDHPLASLPLLGYRVSMARAADGIHKRHVFKLQFKAHIYFFRAEDKFAFRR